jgi:hypothetical protein
MAPAAGQYRQVVGRINTDIRRVQERNDLTAEEKRLRLDALDKAKQDEPMPLSARPASWRRGWGPVEHNADRPTVDARLCPGVQDTD